MKLLQIRTAVFIDPEERVHVFAAEIESLRITDAINRERSEEGSKQQDFGDQKNPHADHGGFPLLIGRGELFPQFQCPGRLGLENTIEFGQGRAPLSSLHRGKEESS